MRDQQEFKDGEEWDMPILNVFRREEAERSVTSGVRSCSTCRPSPARSIATTTFWYPLWNMFDVTPEGRGDFHPKVHY